MHYQENSSGGKEEVKYQDGKEEENGDHIKALNSNSDEMRDLEE